MSPENSKERCEELAEKWLNNTITPEEAKEYAAWYNAGQGEEVNIPREFATGDRELRDRILSKVLGQPLVHKAPAPVRRIWARVAIAAAASIIVVITVRFFLIRNAPANQQDLGANTKQKQDVPPGGDRAILTLADGSQITLDSAVNGQLARQGNANIVKLDNGQLAYNTIYEKNQVSALFNSISTPRGGQYRVVLPDGSKVWLNAASSLRFPTAFNGNERKVELTGEGYFEVREDKNRPFVVRSGRTVVMVLGTNFDLMNYKDEKKAKVTLLQGAVRIDAGGAQNLLLSPGHQAEVDPETGGISEHVGEVSRTIAWTRGLMDLNNEDLGALMRQISRWYDVDVVFQGKVPKARIGGIIHRDVNLSIVLDYLEENGVRYTMKEKAILISP